MSVSSPSSVIRRSARPTRRCVSPRRSRFPKSTAPVRLRGSPVDAAPPHARSRVPPLASRFHQGLCASVVPNRPSSRWDQKTHYERPVVGGTILEALRLPIITCAGHTHPTHDRVTAGAHARRADSDSRDSLVIHVGCPAAPPAARGNSGHSMSEKKGCQLTEWHPKRRSDRPRCRPRLRLKTRSHAPTHPPYLPDGTTRSLRAHRRRRKHRLRRLRRRTAAARRAPSTPISCR